MIIDIEIIIVGAIILIVILWFIWFKFTGIINKIRYNPKNDKGRKAEERRREDNGRTGRESSTAGLGNERFREHEERILLPTTETIVDGKTSNSNGKTSNSNGEVSKQLRTVRRRRINPFKRK